MKKDTFLLKISVSHPIGEEGKTEYVTRNTLTRNLRSRKQNRCGRRLIKDLGERLTMNETDRNGFNSEELRPHPLVTSASPSKWFRTKNIAKSQIRMYLKVRWSQM